jgi:ABC-type nitrate/sulfonate/bicarbonate transport system permease component
MAHARRRVFRGAVIPVMLFVLWELGSRAGVLPLDTTSRPSDIARAAYEGFADGSILRATWETLAAAFTGFAIAALIGVGFGVVLGLAPRLERIVGPSVDALRPIPAVALIPLALLLFGFGLIMEALVVAFACVWPILIVTIAAVRGIEPRLLEVAQVLQLPFVERARKIILPAALGRIVVGLRVALAIALIVGVTVEIVLNPRGLGHGMMGAQQALRPDLMYAQLLWLALVGWVLNRLTQALIARWPGADLEAMR